MNVKISPSILSGKIHVPASKSMMQRACAAALISRGETILVNPGKSKDDQSAISIIQNLGAEIEYIGGNQLKIKSKGVKPVKSLIDCGESGLSTRMFTSIAAMSNEHVTLTGSGTLLARPMNFFDTMLTELSVDFKSNGGNLPFSIKGPLKPKDISINAELSSQFLTGILMAYSASTFPSNTTITVNNLLSKPYIDLTISVIEAFGLNVPANDHYEKFTFKPSSQLPQQKNVTFIIEGDWSSASFLLVAGAISGNIILKGLDLFSAQADKAILQVLMSSGCLISIETDQIEIRHTSLKPFYFDATDCPDLFPPLVALAAYCDGKSVIKGTDRLIHKESNRSITLQQEFEKMGVPILIQDDLMIIDGGGEIKGANLNSHSDHRIVMACSVAALGAISSSTIEEATAINKSYPDFFEDLKSLGALVQI
jgi:3-phosphoshikimate 1-carboxyvinyltransferase